MKIHFKFQTSNFKFRRKLTTFFGTLVALTVLFAIFARLTVPPAAAAWFDDSWEYRKSINIASHTTAENNVYVTVPAFDATDTTRYQSDCGNLRFTDAGGKLLQYFVVDCDATANINVLFETLPAGASNYYMYYGNLNSQNGFVSANFTTAATGLGSQTAGSEAQSPGPISYWRFDEGRGNANDSTTQANTLTVTNAAWRSEEFCISGKCLYFDGNADRASKSYSSDTELLPGTGSFTVSSWLKHTSTAGADTAISRIDAVNGVGWKIYMDSSGFLCLGIDAVAESFPNDSACSTISFADSQWHYVTAVKSTTASITIYVDGIQRAQDASITGVTLDGTSSAFRVGNDFDDGTNGWDGFIDEVKYYNFAKTTAQVQTESVSRGAVKGTSAQMGDPEQQNYLSNSLVGYWKLDETSGNAADSSGNGSALTNNSVTPYTGAKFGNGAEFDGSTDFFDAADNAPLSVTGNLTLAAWIEPDDITGSETIIAKWGATESYLLTKEAANLRLYLNSTSNYEAAIGNPLTANTKTHVAAVYDSTSASVRLYVNGILQSSSTTGTIPSSITDNTNEFSLAAEDTDGTAANFFDGHLDEVRLYSRALSSKEVESLYNWSAGPVGWWKMDENTGVQAFDTSGNNNTGTLTQGPLWSSGKIGSAVSFDGINDYITVTDNSAINFGSGALTISGWFNTSSSSNEYILEKDVNACTNASWLVGVTTAGGCAAGKLDALIGTTSTSCAQEDMCSTTTVNDGIWHHFALVRNPSATNYLYIDGKLDAQKTDQGGSTTNTQPITIGAANNDSGSYSSFFTGLIDEIRLYNYARTPKQIIEDMNAGHPTVGTPIGSYVAYWSLDDASDTTAQDQSTNNNDLTLSTASWTLHGKLDAAWNGTGTSHLARPANDADFDFTAAEDISLSMWFKSDAAGDPAAIEYLAANGGPSGAAGYALYANTNGTLCFSIDDDASWGPDVPSCTATDYYDAAWHHIVGVRDVTADKVNLYIDGILKSSATDTTSATLDSDGTFRLGDIDTDDAASGEELAGDLDEVKVYRLPLSAEDVKLEFNRGSSIVLGSLSTQSDGLTASNSAAAAFCIPGTTCNPPVGWWKLDENSGLTTSDTSGNGNTGNITAGNGGWTFGKSGPAYSFDASSTIVNSGSGSSLDNLPSGGMTIEAWIYPKSAGEGSLGFILAKNVGPTPSSGWIFRLNSTTSLTFTVDGSTDLVRTTNTSLVTQNTWNHVAVIWDGVITTASSADIYVNGVEATYATTTNGASRVDDGTSSLFIGNDSTQASTFDGLIDSVLVYNYIRSRTQINYDYNRGAPVAYYAFDECQGTTAYDTAPKADIRTSGTNGTINPASLGNTAVGTCNSGTATDMWDDGSTGKYNSALGFDGSDDNVTISSVFSLRATNATIATWVYLFDTSESGAFVKLGDESPSNNGYGIGVGASTFDNEGNDLILIYEGASWWDTNRTIGTGWHHVALVVESSGPAQGYIDGNPTRQFSSVGANTPTDSTKIGGYTGSGSQNRFGNYLLDDVRIYNYALNASQMKTLYNEGAAIRFGPVTGSP